MDTKKLAKLVETIISLKEKLKCPICLDVMQEVVELDCGHKYCKECYLEHKSTQKQPSCPLCKKVFKRRSVTYSDHYASCLGKFVYNCCENIRSVYKCEVEQLRIQLGQKAEVLQSKDNILQQNVMSKDNSLAIPSTSKIAVQKPKEIKGILKVKDVKKSNKDTVKVDESSKENYVSAFDKLLSKKPPSTFNKKGTKRVYANKKKLDKKPRVEYDILQFDNHENKTAVLQWLHDTRNKFDRLSQTQTIANDDVCEIPIIDLTSVSQVKKVKDDFKPFAPKSHRGRAKSLEIEVKTPVPTEKKFNSQARSVSLENYNIDDNTEEEEVVKKAEEKVILDLIENEFLEALDNEMQKTKDNEFDIKSKRYTKAKKKGKKPLSPISTTGWERLTKIEKTIKKNERIPKQLNITLQSTQEFKNDNKTATICKETVTENTSEEVNILQSENHDMEENVSRIEEADATKNKTKSPEDQVLIEIAETAPTVADKETDILKTTDIDVGKRLLIVKLTNSDFSNETKMIKLQKQSDAVNKSVVIDEDVDIENKSRPPEEEEAHTEKISNSSKINRNQKQSYDLEKLESYISKNIEIVDNNTSINSDIVSQTLHEEKVQRDVQNSKDLNEEKNKPQISKNHTEKNSDSDSNDSSCVLLDVLFNMPTQKTSYGNNTKPKQEDVIVIDDDISCVESKDPSIQAGASNKKDTSLDEITKLYACPTQKIVDNSTDLRENYNSKEDLLHLLEDCLEKCIANFKSADIVVENQLRNLQFYLSKLKSLHTNDSDVTVKNISVRELSDAETQTFVNITHQTVQTENNGIDIEVQTEDFCCIKCNVDLKRKERIPDDTLISQGTKAAIESMVNETQVDFKPTSHSTISKNSNTPRLKQQSQYDDFTGTLDDLNFDTQEITKNQSTIKKVSPRNTSVKPDATHNEAQTSKAEVGTKIEENIPGSVLVCSLNSGESTVSKKVNRKLIYEPDRSVRFKRIKQPASDSDSEEETPAKRKCNRFLRDDLTVQFLTNPEITNVKDNTKPESQNSEGINYDEYLAEIMKKYEDDHFSSGSSRGFKKPKVRTPQQEANSRCEEMIYNASKNINPGKIVTELSTASSKDSFRTASDSPGNHFDDGLGADDVFMNEDNLLKLENDIREYEKNAKGQNSEISDIIGETEELEPSPKKRKVTVVRSNSPSKKNNKPCSDLKDAEEEKLADTIEAPNENKIQILANVKIKSQDKVKDIKIDDDDLFSDEDIVETTPQKQVHSFAERSANSQIMAPICLDLPVPPTETDNFDFDVDIVPILPPPDFQDDVADIPSTPDHIVNDDDRTNDDTTVIDLNKSSETPDYLSQLIFRNVKTSNELSERIIQAIRESEVENKISNKKNTSDKKIAEEPLNEDKLSQTSDKLTQWNELVQKNVFHSTPIVEVDLTRETLGFSPISAKKSQKMGMMEMAQASKYTPLVTVTKQAPQKQVLFTSTPGQKSIRNFIEPAPPVEKTKPCIAGTRLTKDQLKLIDKLASKKLATINSQFDSTVTHMIITVNDKNCVKDYTIKFVSAVAAGIWVLRFEWIEECLKKNCILPEEPFEVLDISGCPGPRTSRLTRKQNPLFKGYKFFCAKPFLSTTQKELENILRMLEGKVLHDLTELLEDDGNIGIIIGEGHATQNFDQYERWMEVFKTVTVDLEWLSKCIGQYKILSIRPFMWCSEDNLADLGYPSVLTETVPLSYTETF